MDQSPYTPPKTISPPPDQPPKQSGNGRLLFGLLAATIDFLGPLLFIAWGLGLGYGWICNSRLAFHIIYATLILGPAIGCFIFAFVGRAPVSADRARIWNWIGTAGYCIIGLTFVGLYATALVYKL